MTFKPLKELIINHKTMLTLNSTFISCKPRQVITKKGKKLIFNEGILADDGRVRLVLFKEHVEANPGDEVTIDCYAKWDDFKKQIVFVEV